MSGTDWDLDDNRTNTEVLSREDCRFILTGEDTYSKNRHHSRLSDKAQALPDRIQKLLDDIALLAETDHLPAEKGLDDTHAFDSRAAFVRSDPVITPHRSDLAFALGTAMRSLAPEADPVDVVWGFLIGLVGNTDDPEGEANRIETVLERMEEHHSQRLVDIGTMLHQRRNDSRAVEREITRSVLTEHDLQPAPALVRSLLALQPEYALSQRPGTIESDRSGQADTDDDGSGVGGEDGTADHVERADDDHTGTASAADESSEPLVTGLPDTSEDHSEEGETVPMPDPPDGPVLDSPAEVFRWEVDGIVAELVAERSLAEIDRLCTTLRTDLAEIEDHQMFGTDAVAVLRSLYEADGEKSSAVLGKQSDPKHMTTAVLNRLSVKPDRELWTTRPVATNTGDDKWQLTPYGELLCAVRFDRDGDIEWLYEYVFNQDALAPSTVEHVAKVVSDDST